MVIHALNIKPADLLRKLLWWSNDSSDPQRFTERRHLMAVGDPKDRVIWRDWKRVAAKVCQVDEALRFDTVRLHPLEGRHKIGPPTAFGRQLDRF